MLTPTVVAPALHGAPREVRYNIRIALLHHNESGEHCCSVRLRLRDLCNVHTLKEKICSSVQKAGKTLAYSSIVFRNKKGGDFHASSRISLLPHGKAEKGFDFIFMGEIDKRRNLGFIQSKLARSFGLDPDMLDEQQLRRDAQTLRVATYREATVCPECTNVDIDERGNCTSCGYSAIDMGDLRLDDTMFACAPPASSETVDSNIAEAVRAIGGSNHVARHANKLRQLFFRCHKTPPFALPGQRGTEFRWHIAAVNAARLAAVTGATPRRCEACSRTFSSDKMLRLHTTMEHAAGAEEPAAEPAAGAEEPAAEPVAPQSPVVRTRAGGDAATDGKRRRFGN